MGKTVDNRDFEGRLRASMDSVEVRAAKVLGILADVADGKRPDLPIIKVQGEAYLVRPINSPDAWAEDIPDCGPLVMAVAVLESCGLVARRKVGIQASTGRKVARPTSALRATAKGREMAARLRQAGLGASWAI